MEYLKFDNNVINTRYVKNIKKVNENEYIIIVANTCSTGATWTAGDEEYRCSKFEIVTINDGNQNSFFN